MHKARYRQYETIMKRQHLDDIYSRHAIFECFGTNHINITKNTLLTNHYTKTVSDATKSQLYVKPKVFFLSLFLLFLFSFYSCNR
jgi:hypothetical protein